MDLTAIKHYLSDVPGSIKGYLNAEELGRAIWTSIGSGGLATALLVIVTALSDHAAAIFSPSSVGVWTALFALAADIIRRQSRGMPAVMTPVPASADLSAAKSTADVPVSTISSVSATSSDPAGHPHSVTVAVEPELPTVAV